MMDSVNSTTFIKRPPCMTETQEKLLYTEELLSGRIFLGCYQERRYVSALREYRDVVIINSEEVDLQSDIDRLGQKWLGVRNIKWVGITGPGAVDLPKVYCFWVKFTELAFGHYWFQIKNVKLIDEEILLHLKCIRKTQALHPASATYMKNSYMPQNQNEKSEPSGSLFLSPNKINWEVLKGVFLPVTERCTETINTIMPHLTWANLTHIVKVACALTIAFVVGTITFFSHLGEFVLKLIRELSLLVHAFSPIIIHVIDFFTKIIGGLFILLAALLKVRVYAPSSGQNKNSNLYSSDIVQIPAVDWRERNLQLRKEFFSNKFRE